MKHVLDLELCQELEKRGIEIDTEFRYIWNLDCNCYVLRNHAEIAIHFVQGTGCYYNNRQISAPITDELLERMPRNIISNNEYFELTITIIPDSEGERFYNVSYKHINSPTTIKVYIDYLSNALTKMIIWLFDNGYLK